MNAIGTDNNIWYRDGSTVRWFSMPFPTRMVVARLENKELFIHSPVQLTDDVRHDVEKLGRPRYLVSPNKLHHIFLKQWQDAYPDAFLYIPRGLHSSRPDLNYHKELTDTPEAAWEKYIDQLVFRGSRLFEELVFFHKQSRTLIIGDLIENFDPSSLSWFHRVLAWYARILAPHGETPRDYRFSFRGNKLLARASFERILEWQPQRIIMCHGIPVETKADAFLKNAFRWTY
jgi:hypothetical protein